ncbi:hypothetical protein AAHE18_01G158700 [Arachis hypogaea]
MRSDLPVQLIRVGAESQEKKKDRKKKGELSESDRPAQNVRFEVSTKNSEEKKRLKLEAGENDKEEENKGIERLRFVFFFFFLNFSLSSRLKKLPNEMKHSTRFFNLYMHTGKASLS